MKTRMTFRLPDALATRLRELPNQTEFVEAALLDALGTRCPVCEGTGRLVTRTPRLPNWREARLPRLDRDTALQLKAIVQLARDLGATDVTISEDATHGGLRVALVRQHEQLFAGTIRDGHTQMALH